jgi:hypothetical protein
LARPPATTRSPRVRPDRPGRHGRRLRSAPQPGGARCAGDGRPRNHSGPCGLRRFTAGCRAVGAVRGTRPGRYCGESVHRRLCWGSPDCWKVAARPLTGPRRIKRAALLSACTVDADVVWVDEGDIPSSAGLAAGVDLCLHLHYSRRATSRLRRWPCRAGFGSTSGLRAYLRHQTATTPTAQRTAFGGLTTTHG